MVNNRGYIHSDADTTELESILNKLPTELLVKGYKAFETTANMCNCSKCFVAEITSYVPLPFSYFSDFIDHATRKLSTFGIIKPDIYYLIATFDREYKDDVNHYDFMLVVEKLIVQRGYSYNNGEFTKDANTII